MTDIKPCTVKGCRETVIHHHDDPAAPHPKAWPCSVSGCDFPYGREGQFGPAVAPAPRQTRKALNARIAELEAENADLHAEIADKKDRLARFEKPAPAPAPAPINLSLTLPAGVDAFEVGNQFGQLLSAIAPGAKLRFAGGAR